MNSTTLKTRSVQALILIAHLALLYWIFYTLNLGGSLPTVTLTFHFIGMALYGALLIRGTAYITKRDYLKQQNSLNDGNSQT